MNQHETIGKWEKRWHPLREEWIVYSAHRNNRPWQGAGLLKESASLPYEPTCYLCPGNQRISGIFNPQYQDVYIFENDHPVVGRLAPEVASNDFYKREKATGIAKVVCYDPRHHVTLSKMRLENVIPVFKAFQQEMIEFEKDPAIKSVLIFENKGEAVGVSNPHPHCQIYAVDFHLNYVEQQVEIADKHWQTYHKNIFNEIIESEIKDGRRIIAETKNAIAFIPFFARYAYEVMIFPKNLHRSLITLSTEELEDLVAVYHQVIRKLDMNYDINFPYVMSIMQAPVDGIHYEHFWMYIWLQPPFRQPGLIKYLAGPEIGAGNFMADTMPEEKAHELRKLNLADYRHEQ